MNTIKTILLIVIVAVFTSCSKNDTPINQAPVLENKTMSMDENPTADLLTTLVATDDEEDTLTYAIVSQTPANSVGVNSTTGEVYIVSARAFDYEKNTQIIVNIEVTDGVNITLSTLNINILDVQENG